MDTKFLMRAMLAGVLLAFVGIGLFLGMYFIVLPNAADTTRLFASLIVPPFVLAIMVGGYYLLVAGRTSDDS